MLPHDVVLKAGLGSVLLAFSLIDGSLPVGDQLRQVPPPPAPTRTEGYLPRRLYPGTYGEFCGPTPEIEVKQSCTIHGWHSDFPKDEVDQACMLHDISYCQCETELLDRRQLPKEDIPMLSSLVALRFVFKPVLERNLQVDQEYFECINKADRKLVATGIELRSKLQSNECSSDSALSWFCELDKGTLNIFEKINLAVFLRDLDFDATGREKEPESLTELERRRQLDLKQQLKSSKRLPDSVSSDAVRGDEQKVLQRLMGDKVQ